MLSESCCKETSILPRYLKPLCGILTCLYFTEVAHFCLWQKLQFCHHPLFFALVLTSNCYFDAQGCVPTLLFSPTPRRSYFKWTIHALIVDGITLERKKQAQSFLWHTKLATKTQNASPSIFIFFYISAAADCRRETAVTPQDA